MKFCLILFLCAPCALAKEVPQWNPWTTVIDQVKNETDKVNTFVVNQQRNIEDGLRTSYNKIKNATDEATLKIKRTNAEVNKSINDYVTSAKKTSNEFVNRLISAVPLGESDKSDYMEYPEAELSVQGIIARDGYRCETHIVPVQGYLLTLHRIPRSKTIKTKVSSKTILLHHGLFASSADWVISGPGKALAYILADAGYDVWMANVRGNKYSSEHAWLKRDTFSYWNFSWHEVAMFDVPAIIDYILEVKGPCKITYIGHSMGTTILFAFLSLHPEYNSILNAGLALAPVVYMSDIKTPLKSLAPHANNIGYLSKVIGQNEFLPKQSFLRSLSDYTCSVNKVDEFVCEKAIFVICGYDEEQFNKTLLPVFMSHLGTGTSTKTAIHFAQEINDGGRFQHFNYGETKNLEVYGQSNPPEYDLGSITLPIGLFWSKNDWLSGEKDVRRLYENLPNPVQFYEVPYEKFNHLDYLWAIDAPALLYNRLLEVLNDLNI